jgi:hypothetical protein
VPLSSGSRTLSPVSSSPLSLSSLSSLGWSGWLSVWQAAFRVITLTPRWAAGVRAVNFSYPSQTNATHQLYGRWSSQSRSSSLLARVVLVSRPRPPSLSARASQQNMVSSHAVEAKHSRTWPNSTSSCSTRQEPILKAGSPRSPTSRSFLHPGGPARPSSALPLSWNLLLPTH